MALCPPASPSSCQPAPIFSSQPSLRPPCRPRAGGEEASAAAPEGEPGGEPGAGLLPPCVLADRAKHGPLTYQLHYRLQPAAP